MVVVGQIERERKEKQDGKDGILSMLCNSHLGEGGDKVSRAAGTGGH